MSGPDDLLVPWLLGHLDSRDAEEVAAAVDGSADLAAEVDRLQPVTAILGRAGTRARREPPLPAALLDTVVARIDEARASAPISLDERRRRSAAEPDPAEPMPADEPVAERTRRWRRPRIQRVTLVVAVLAAAAGAAAGAVLARSPATVERRGRVVGLVAASAQPGRPSGQVELVDEPWGTAVTATVRGLPPGRYLVVVGAIGLPSSAADFVATGEAVVRVTTAAEPDAIGRITVSSGGEVLLEADLGG